MAYALLFEKMMELVRIPCYYIVGHAEGEGDAGHAWNMVQLDGEWYHIDATWGDLGKTERFNICYQYFLLSDNEIARNHTWSLIDYPPCTSDRFKPLHRLYNVAIEGAALYYPHPKTALLYKLDLDNKLQAEKLLDMRVQHCMLLDGKFYFSNYSANGHLYYYDFECGESVLVRKELVKQIVRNRDGIEVHFETGDTFQLDRQADEELVVDEKAILLEDVAYIDVPFMHFDTTWLGTFEGDGPVRFVSEEGLKLHVPNVTKQLTVQIELDMALYVELTSARKRIVASNVVLQIPKQLVQFEIEAAVVDGEFLWVQV